MNLELSKIKPYPKNTKKHPQKQIKQIADSIKEFGFNQPLVIDKDNVIIVGHGRYEAAKLLNLDKVPVLQVNLSEKKAKAYRLADNKLNESDWDMDLVIEELKSLEDDALVALSGFEKDLLIEPDEKDDIIPENVETRVKLGDIWQLGRHRVMCGDSTKREDVDKLMGGVKASLIFSSPPYNMGKDMYKTYSDNLPSDEYVNFNIKVIENWGQYLQGFLFWNISYNRNSRKEFLEIAYKVSKLSNLHFLELICWNKKYAMAVTDKNFMIRSYEDIFVYENESREDDPDYMMLMKNNDKFYRKIQGVRLNNYWELTTPMNTQIKMNKACYPVGLPVKGIIITTEENQIVSDPFLGSGTTLIACEKTNRINYGMELDNLQCDVVLQRYKDYTGVEPIKVV